MNINKSAGIFDFLRPRFRSGGGTHWFPAVDVCTEFGYATPRKALLDHVPEEHRKNLETVTGSHGLSIPAGRSWRRDLNLIDLQWAAEVIETVQREGSYTLEEAEVQPAEPGAPIAYAMPEQVAEAIVRLEERNLQADEQFAVAQHKSLALQQEIVDTQQKIAGTQQKIADTQQEMLDLQRATLAAQQTIAQAMERIADRLDMLAFQRPAPPTAEQAAPPTTESVLADWRRRLAVTEDVWTVAVVIALVMVEEGELRQPLEVIAARTGLSVQRVNECLRMLRKHACIRQQSAAEDGAPVYVLN